MACLGATPAIAQQIPTSLLPDATVLAPRSMRVRVLSAFTRYDDLLGNGGTRNLGSLLATDSLGALLTVGLDGKRPERLQWAISDVYDLIVGHFGIDD